MAEGLFGFKSPTELQNEYYSGLMVSPAQIGQQGLLQQLVSTAANAGAMMGYGGGRLLGGKVAGEADAMAFKEALNETKGEADPVKRLRSMAEILTSKGMDDVAFKVSAQADKFEEAALSKQERQSRMTIAEQEAALKKKAAEDRPKIIENRKQSLLRQFPKMTEAELESVASDDATFRTYIKPPKDYTPSEYGKMLIESGLNPESEEYKTKMAAYAEAKAKPPGDDAATLLLKNEAKRLEIELAKQKLEAGKGKEEKARRAAKLRMLTSEYNTKQMVSRVDEASKLVNNLTAGFGGLLKDLPTSKARTLRARLDTLKARIGFDTLQAMRDSSPTGGALGQVSERELGFLQATIANLDQLQDPDELKAELEKVKEHYLNFLKYQKMSEEANEPLFGTDEWEKWNSQQKSATPSPDAGGKPKPNKRFNPATGKLEDV